MRNDVSQPPGQRRPAVVVSGIDSPSREGSGPEDDATGYALLHDAFRRHSFVASRRRRAVPLLQQPQVQPALVRDHLGNPTWDPCHCVVPVRALGVPARGVKGTVVPTAARTGKRPVEILTGISISPTTHIGPGLDVAHFGGVFVGGDSVLGCELQSGARYPHRGGRPRRAARLSAAGRQGKRDLWRARPRTRTRRRRRDDGLNVVVSSDVPPRTVLAAAAPIVLSHRGRLSTCAMPVTRLTRIGVNQQAIAATPSGSFRAIP